MTGPLNDWNSIPAPITTARRGRTPQARTAPPPSRSFPSAATPPGRLREIVAQQRINHLVNNIIAFIYQLVKNRPTRVSNIPSLKAE
jgi:hypothetical protein